MSKIKITFGIIVLNGEPFTRYNLRAIYPFAHQIIVVEGACPGAKNICSKDGHSLDSTLDSLRNFKLNEDTENKLIIITAEDEGKPNGFWSEKDEMSEAYAKHATGNYIWQVDIDEFYKPDDMKAVMKMLENVQNITAITFRTHTFWGSLKYKVDSMSLRVMIQDVHRIFAWDKGCQYKSHRPPTVVNKDGIDLRSLKWLTAVDMVKQGIYMYHYAFLFPKQVEEKCNYYYNSTWSGGKELSSLSWAEQSYFRLEHPFKVYYNNSELSWLEKFKDTHPPQVIDMFTDVKSGKFSGIYTRKNDNIEELLNDTIFKVKRIFVRFCVYMYSIFYKFKLKIRSLLIKTHIWPMVQIIRKLKAK